MDGERGSSEVRRRRRGLRWPWARALLAAPVAACVTATAVAAQAPETVRDTLAPPGIYVAPGAADPVALTATVERARQAGFELVVVVAEDPRPDPSAFAMRVRQLGVGDPVVVFGPGGAFGVSSEALDGPDLLRARRAAEEHRSPEAASAAFTDALLDDPEEVVPDIADDVVRVVVIAVGVLVVSVAAGEVLRRDRRRRRAARSGPPTSRTSTST